MIRIVRLLLATLILAAAPAWAAERTKPLAIGDSAPALELGDQHGKPFKLGDALGSQRFVVLAFYPKAFTSG